MRKIVAIIPAILTILYSEVASANFNVPTNQQPSFTINKLSAAATNVVLYLDSNHNACGGSTEVVIDWSTSSDIRNLYATALAAFSAGKKVGFGAYDCSGSATISVYRIDVAK